MLVVFLRFLYVKIGSPKLVTTKKQPNLLPYGGGSPLSVLAHVKLMQRQTGQLEIMNKAVIRERHFISTAKQLIHDLNRAVVFSKLGVRSCYRQLELYISSRYITTFSTHCGLFLYKRLDFDISSASEIFQQENRGVIRSIPGAKISRMA